MNNKTINQPILHCKHRIQIKIEFKVYCSLQQINLLERLIFRVDKLIEEKSN